MKRSWRLIRRLIVILIAAGTSVTDGSAQTVSAVQTICQLPTRLSSGRRIYEEILAAQLRTQLPDARVSISFSSLSNSQNIQIGGFPNTNLQVSLNGLNLSLQGALPLEPCTVQTPVRITVRGTAPTGEAVRIRSRALITVTGLRVPRRIGTSFVGSGSSSAF